MLCLCNNVLCSANNEFMSPCQTTAHVSTKMTTTNYNSPAHRAPHRTEQRKEQECKPEPCFFLIGSMRAQQNANLVFSRHCKHQEHREPCLREWSATTKRTSFWSVVVSLTRAIFSRHGKHQEHREPCLRDWSASHMTTMRTSFWSVVVSLTRAKANLVFVQCHETRQNRLRTRTVFLLMV
jgi:hypothetical protein